jgi:hypothetical protein
VSAADAYSCATCGDAIEPDAEHYPHEPDCQLGVLGWCSCHAPTHPDCCPECDPTTPY